MGLIGAKWHRRGPGGGSWLPVEHIRAVFRDDGLHERLGHHHLDELPGLPSPPADDLPPAVPLDPVGPVDDEGSLAPVPLMETSDQGSASGKPLRVLGVSLFDGCGAFGVLFEPFLGKHMSWAGRVSCECDAQCRRVLAHRFPNLMDVPDVRDFSEGLVDYILDAYDCDLVVLAGGSPCQQLSRAGRQWEGLRGKDSVLFFEFRRVLFLFRAACVRRGRAFFFLLENVLPGDEKTCQSLRRPWVPTSLSSSKLATLDGPGAPGLFGPIFLCLTDFADTFAMSRVVSTGNC